MSTDSKKPVTTHTEVIAGKKVKVASSADVKAAVDKVKAQYAQTLENLKNR